MITLNFLPMVYEEGGLLSFLSPTRIAGRLKRPEIWKEDKHSPWQATASSAHDRSHQQVTLVVYDPCPAFVIARKEGGKRWRCPREVMFTPATIDREELFRALAIAMVAAHGDIR